MRIVIIKRKHREETSTTKNLPKSVLSYVKGGWPRTLILEKEDLEPSISEDFTSFATHMKQDFVEVYYYY